MGDKVLNEAFACIYIRLNSKFFFSEWNFILIQNITGCLANKAPKSLNTWLFWEIPRIASPSGQLALLSCSLNKKKTFFWFEKMISCCSWPVGEDTWRHSSICKYLGPWELPLHQHWLPPSMKLCLQKPCMIFFRHSVKTELEKVLLRRQVRKDCCVELRMMMMRMWSLSIYIELWGWPSWFGLWFGLGCATVGG